MPATGATSSQPDRPADGAGSCVWECAFRGQPRPSPEEVARQVGEWLVGTEDPEGEVDGSDAFIGFCVTQKTMTVPKVA